jgi:hypothetical protein
MTIQEFESFLTESGVDDATVKALVANEKVKTRAVSFRQQSEYEALEARARQLETEGAQAKNYQVWYEKNYPEIQKLHTTATKYQERYGSLDEPTTQTQTQQATSMTEEQIAALVQARLDKAFNEQYAPRVVSTMTGIGKVVETHMRRGRKDNLDWKKLDELAAKTNGDVLAAYEEYDKPNTDADREAEIARRIEAGVKERMASAGARDHFPGGADATPSSKGLFGHPSNSSKTYDSSKLVDTFLSGTYTPGVTQ